MKKLLLFAICIIGYTSLNAQVEFETQKKELKTQIKNTVDMLSLTISSMKETLANEQMEMSSYIDNWSETIRMQNESLLELNSQLIDLEAQEIAAKKQLEDPKVVENEMEEEVAPPVESTTKPKKFKAPLKFRLMSFFKKSTIIYGVGVSQLIAEDKEMFSQDFWKSSDYELGLGFNKSIGESQKMKLFYGITYNKKSIRIKDIDIINSSTTNGYEVVDTRAFHKVKLGASYVTIPLGLKFKLSKKANIYIGGHLGYNIKSFVERTFTSIHDEEVLSIAIAPFGFNKFNYGADVSMGFSFFKLYGKYDFSPLFENGPKHNMFSIGIRTY